MTLSVERQDTLDLFKNSSASEKAIRNYFEQTYHKLTEDELIEIFVQQPEYVSALPNPSQRVQDALVERYPERAMILLKEKSVRTKVALICYSSTIYRQIENPSEVETLAFLLHNSTQENTRYFVDACNNGRVDATSKNIFTCLLYSSSDMIFDIRDYDLKTMHPAWILQLCRVRSDMIQVMQRRGIAVTAEHIAESLSVPDVRSDAQFYIDYLTTCKDQAIITSLVQQRPSLLMYIKNPSEEQLWVGIKRNPNRVWFHINSERITQEMIIYAVRNNPALSIVLRDHLTPELRQEMIEQIPTLGLLFDDLTHQEKQYLAFAALTS